jgi:hypothetical protein
MAPVDPLAELFKEKVKEFVIERSRKLSEVDINKLGILYYEINAMPFELSKPLDYYWFTTRYFFTRFIVNLSNNLNTSTPNWKKILLILTNMWASYSDHISSNAFWGIGSRCCQDCQRESLSCIDSEMHLDGLIESNHTGISLERIMLSFSITITLCNVNCMFYVLTPKVVSMFINQLYFDDYIHRNELLMIEKETMPYVNETYEDEEYESEYEFDPEDRMNLFGPTIVVPHQSWMESEEEISEEDLSEEDLSEEDNTDE